MESIQPQLDDLSSSLEDLETSLQPIITTALSASTSKLPLLDKAKLYVLATYALESILFSFLRLNGVEAKSHPVYQELNRVKAYFAKVKTAEEVGAGGKSAGAGRLDKDAAGRFIKAGLSGNDRYDRERKERQERERAGAKRKLEGMGMHTRFDGSAKRIKADEEGEKINVVSAADALSEDDDEDGGVELPAEPAKKEKKSKRRSWKDAPPGTQKKPREKKPRDKKKTLLAGKKWDKIGKKGDGNIEKTQFEEGGDDVSIME